MSGRVRDALLSPLVLCAALAVPARAQFFGATVLQIPPCARTLGMGEAAAAVVEHADALWFNPAALAFTSSSAAVAYTHTDLIPDLAPDVGQDFLAFSFRLQGIGGIAAGAAFLDYGRSTARNFNGDVLGEFRSYELVPAFAFGGRVSDQIGIGLGYKLVHVNLFPATLDPMGLGGEATTAAVDLGCQWRPNTSTRVGVSFQNLGSGLTFGASDRPDPLPRNLKLGVAQELIAGGAGHFLLAADLNKSLVRAEYEPILNAGAECQLEWRDLGAAVRFGWIYDGWLFEEQPINDPTFGFGLGFKGLSFDYASVPLAFEVERRSYLSLGAAF